MGQIAAVVPDDFSGPEHQLRSGMAQILHQLHISLHAGGDAASAVQPQADGGVDGGVPDGPDGVQPQLDGPLHHEVQMALPHEPGQGNIVRHQADAVLHRCIIHGLDDFPVQHAFLYLHREAQSQLLSELFSRGNGVVAVDAHGPESLQAAAGEGGDMAIQKNAVVGGSFNDGEHPLIPGGDGVEIHDLAQSSHAGNIQQGLHLSGANIKTGILQTGGGGNGGGGGEEHPQGQVPAGVRQAPDSLDAQHVGDLVGVGAHRGGAAGEGHPGKVVGGQHAAFQMHVGIHEARQGISAAAVHGSAALRRFLRAENPGDMTVDNADRSAYNRGAEHIDDLHIADHQVKGASAQHSFGDIFQHSGAPLHFVCQK